MVVHWFESGGSASSREIPKAVRATGRPRRLSMDSA